MNFTEEEIIKMNTPLIYKIARQFYNVDKEDLFQEGAQAVKIAYKNYRKNGTTKFSTYAYSYIYGAMYAYTYQQNHVIKVGREVLREYKKIESTRYELAQKLRRIPTYDEVAIYLEKDISEVNHIVASATTVLIHMDQNENQRSMYESIPQEENISLDDQILLQEGFDILNEDEKQIIKYRYYHDLTQQEVAKKLNKTQVMVSRYEKRSLDKMRNFMTS